MKVALVTGGASGIGAAICRTLAARGVHVAVNHRGTSSLAQAQAVASDCRSMGSEAEPVAGDVGDDRDCRRIVAAVAARWGRLDYLVNNAAIAHQRKLSDLDGVEVADFENEFRVNSIGPFLPSRYCAPHMRAAKEGGRGGAIVNVASMSGLLGIGASYGYLASKAALINLTRSLARVLAPDIRVNAVCPGMVDTPWSRGDLGPRFDEIAGLVEKRLPLGRMLTPQDVATPVSFLLLDAAQVTGEIMRIDGGGHLGPRT